MRTGVCDALRTPGEAMPHGDLENLRSDAPSSAVPPVWG